MYSTIQRRARRHLIAAALVLGSVATACTAKSSDQSSHTNGTVSQAQAQYGGQAVVGLTGETDSWSPQNGRWSPSSMMVANAIFDPLATLDKDGNIKPYLAESFTPNADFTQWDIRIRKGIKFHNGEDMGSGALAYNLESLRKSPLTAFPFKPITNLEKLDDLTVRVTVSSPWGRFPAIFATQTGYMAAPAQLRGDVDNRHPIGTGPFKFKDWRPDDKLLVTRNENYWQKDSQGRNLPYLDQIEFRVLPDESSRVAAFRSGDLDTTHSVHGSQVAEWAAGRDVPENAQVLIDTGESDELTAMLNSQTGPFSDLRLRRAAALATDRQAITDQTSNGFFKVADQPFREGSPWHVDDVGWPEYNPDQARQLVNEWKADNGGQDPSVKVEVTTSQDDLQAAQILQQQWKQVGIDAHLQATEETAFAQDLLAGKWDAIWVRYWNKPDPDAEYVFWHGSNIGAPGSISLNLMRYSNPTIDKALDAGRASGDQDVRKAEYAKVWKEWAANVPVVWLFHAQWGFITSHHLHGVGVHTFPDGTPIQPIIWGATFFTSAWVER